MKAVFADTFYWTALLNPRDQFHQSVKSLSRTLGSVNLVTTDDVLTEFLNFFSAYKPQMRQGAVQRVQDILQNDRIQVIPSNREQFLAGVALYQQRPDKEYSLTDCISMQTMWQLAITEVLTHDKHFAQEGFVVLI